MLMKLTQGFLLHGPVEKVHLPAPDALEVADSVSQDHPGTNVIKLYCSVIDALAQQARVVCHDRHCYCKKLGEMANNQKVNPKRSTTQKSARKNKNIFGTFRIMENLKYVCPNMAKNQFYLKLPIDIL